MAVCSGGGHWIEMQRLLPAFEGSAVDLVFVSTHAAGDAVQAGRPYYQIRNATRRDRLAFAVLAVQLARILRKERPEVVVTTGAAPGLVALALARWLCGSRTVWIDFDRRRRAPVDVGAVGPAGGRRLAGPVAAPGAPGRPALLGRGAVIFVTVGSMFPFDRLVRAMDAWAAAHPEEEVLAQIGDGGFEPWHMRWQRLLDRAPFDDTVRRARLVVAHAGVGSVVTARTLGRPVVVLPRRRQLGEHTCDHQVETVGWLRGRPGIHVADGEEDLAARIAEAAGRRGRRGAAADRRPGLHRPPPSLHRRGLNSAPHPGARGRSKPRPDAAETSTGVFRPRY